MPTSHPTQPTDNSTPVDGSPDIDADYPLKGLLDHDHLKEMVLPGFTPEPRCVVIASPTGAGKTVFCVQAALDALRQGSLVVFLSGQLDEANFLETASRAGWGDSPEDSDSAVRFLRKNDGKDFRFRYIPAASGESVSLHEELEELTKDSGDGKLHRQSLVVLDGFYPSAKEDPKAWLSARLKEARRILGRFSVFLITVDVTERHFVLPVIQPWHLPGGGPSLEDYDLFIGLSASRPYAGEEYGERFSKRQILRHVDAKAKWQGRIPYLQDFESRRMGFRHIPALVRDLFQKGWIWLTPEERDGMVEPGLNAMNVYICFAFHTTYPRKGARKSVAKMSGLPGHTFISMRAVAMQTGLTLNQVRRAVDDLLLFDMLKVVGKEARGRMRAGRARVMRLPWQKQYASGIGRWSFKLPRGILKTRVFRHPMALRLYLYVVLNARSKPCGGEIPVGHLHIDALEDAEFATFVFGHEVILSPESKVELDALDDAFRMLQEEDLIMVQKCCEVTGLPTQIRLHQSDKYYT